MRHIPITETTGTRKVCDTQLLAVFVVLTINVYEVCLKLNETINFYIPRKTSRRKCRC